MVKSLRVTYTRRNPYNTKSNAIKMVKTPGGRMAGHYVKKAAKGPRCGDCGVTLPGVSALSLSLSFYHTLSVSVASRRALCITITCS